MMLCQVSRSAKAQQCIRTFTSLQRAFYGKHLSNTGPSSPLLRQLTQHEFSWQSSRSQFHSRNYEKDTKKKPFYKRISKEMKVTVGMGATLAAFLIYMDYTGRAKKNDNRVHELRSGGSALLGEKPPEQQIARSIQNPKDASGLKLTLFQYQTCPFCCKLRAFLDYHGFSYDVVEVNSVTRTQTKWTTYKKVPFLVVEIAGTEYGESTVLQLKDSSVIISVLSSVLRNPNESFSNILESYPSFYNEDNKLEFSNRFNVMYGENTEVLKHIDDIEQERKWRQWVDDVFVHMLSPNVYRTPTEALQAFTWFSEVGQWEKLFSTWERLLVIYLGAAVMWIIGKRLKSRYHLNSNPRISLYKEARTWSKEVAASGGEFMGGPRPNLADLNMYGVLTAIEGCDAFQDLMANSSKLRKWYTEMKTRVEQREGEHALIARCSIR